MSSHWNDLQRNNERTINAQRERIADLERQLAEARAEIDRLRAENKRLSFLHNLELDRSNGEFAALTTPGGEADE